MMADVLRYEFAYDTMVLDGPNISTMFALGGISEDVAKGIRFGLRKVPTITNVTAQRITESKEVVVGDPPA